MTPAAERDALLIPNAARGLAAYVPELLALCRALAAEASEAAELQTERSPSLCSAEDAAAPADVAASVQEAVNALRGALDVVRHARRQLGAALGPSA